jgi:hypothetical protein
MSSFALPVSYHIGLKETRAKFHKLFPRRKEQRLFTGHTAAAYTTIRVVLSKKRIDKIIPMLLK